MKSNYKKLGEYIREVNIGNKDLQISLLLGVRISKEFIPSIANTVGTDFSNYKIVEKAQFAYGPVTSRNGDKISIALLKEDKCIISSSYMVFEIIDKSVLLPEYLMMWFRRPEFDRYARFKSEGSVREIFSWNELCNVELPVPDIDKQRKIVEQYNQINKAIQIKEAINNNLEQQAQAIFKSWFVDFSHFEGNKPDFWVEGTIGDFVDIKRGGSPRPIQDYISEDGLRWLKISDATAIDAPFIFDIKEHIKESGLRKTVYLKSGSLVLSNSATPGIPRILSVDSCIHDGWLYFPKSKFTNEFLYLLFKNVRKSLVALGNGSIFTNLKTDILKNFNTILPDSDTLKKFDIIIKPYFTFMENNQREIRNLTNLRSALLPKLMLENSDSSSDKLSFI